MSESSKPGMFLRISIAQILTAVSSVWCVAGAVISFFSGNGFTMISYILDLVMLTSLFFSVIPVFYTPKMTQLPAVFMCFYFAFLVLRFKITWLFFLALIPVGFMVWLMLAQDFALPGILAGVSAFLINILIAFATYYSRFDVNSVLSFLNKDYSSLYFAFYLLSDMSLSGIACVLYFCFIPEEQRWVRNEIYGADTEAAVNDDGGFY